MFTLNRVIAVMQLLAIVEIFYSSSGPPWRPLSFSFHCLGWLGCLESWLLITKQLCLHGCSLSVIPPRFVMPQELLNAPSWWLCTFHMKLTMSTLCIMSYMKLQMVKYFEGYTHFAWTKLTIFQVTVMIPILFFAFTFSNINGLCWTQSYYTIYNIIIAGSSNLVLPCDQKWDSVG